ncbi:hypothetical protein ACN47E_004766 [Coniothyrium glycines]
MLIATSIDQGRTKSRRAGPTSVPAPARRKAARLRTTTVSLKPIPECNYVHVGNNETAEPRCLRIDGSTLADPRRARCATHAPKKRTEQDTNDTNGIQSAAKLVATDLVKVYHVVMSVGTAKQQRIHAGQLDSQRLRTNVEEARTKRSAFWQQIYPAFEDDG